MLHLPISQARNPAVFNPSIHFFHLFTYGSDVAAWKVSRVPSPQCPVGSFEAAVKYLFYLYALQKAPLQCHFSKFIISNLTYHHSLPADLLALPHCNSIAYGDRPLIKGSFSDSLVQIVAKLFKIWSLATHLSCISSQKYPSSKLSKISPCCIIFHAFGPLLILSRLIYLSNHSFFLINLFIYLFLAALGLRCCTRAFSSCGERGLLFVVRASHCGGFSCCGARAQ